MVEEIVSGVYDITCDDTDGKRYRVFLFDTDVPTVIDAGLESTVESVFEGIDEIGVEPEHLIITHGDGDHIGGFEAISDRYELETWVPEQTAADVESDHRYGDRDAIARLRDLINTTRLHARIYLKGHDTVADGQS